MAYTVQIDSEFDVGLEEFLLFMKDPRLHDYVKMRQGVQRQELVALSQSGAIRCWTVALGVDEQLPAFVRSFVPAGGLTWSQHFRMNMETHALTFEVQHPFPAHFMRVRGCGEILPRGPDRTAWHLEVTFHSELLLVGSRAERYAGERTRTMMALDARYRQEFISAHRGAPQPTLELEGKEQERP